MSISDLSSELEIQRRHEQLAARLVRLRANPRIVRVSLCRVEGGVWQYTIASRDGPEYARGWGSTPARALVVAMRAAMRIRLFGVDRYCVWTYEHPQKVPGGATETSESFRSGAATC